jgi:mutator family transposase
LFDDWFDPIEAGVRNRVRGFIEAMIEGELDSALLRPRYGRRPKLANEDADGSAGLTGHRHGHRSRSLTGTFGGVEIAVPWARINGEDGKTLEWKSKVLLAYQRRTLAADVLIASTYLSGTNTRRAPPPSIYQITRQITSGSQTSKAGRRRMRSLFWIMAATVVTAMSGDALAQSAGPFDGKWTTVVSCPAAEGAGSFTLLVDADIKSGVFSGEKGDKGKPGWYSLNGKVQSDGAVEIFARGIVPSSRLAAGNVPVGTKYGYPIMGRLEGSKGTGSRQGGRPCSVSFTKQ